jgi:hypothetical protein
VPKAVLATANNPEGVCDRREYKSCDKAVDEGFDDANQHPQQRPNMASVS